MTQSRQARPLRLLDVLCMCLCADSQDVFHPDDLFLHAVLANRQLPAGGSRLPSGLVELVSIILDVPNICLW